MDEQRVIKSFFLADSKEENNQLSDLKRTSMLMAIMKGIKRNMEGNSYE